MDSRREEERLREESGREWGSIPPVDKGEGWKGRGGEGRVKEGSKPRNPDQESAGRTRRKLAEGGDAGPGQGGNSDERGGVGLEGEAVALILS